MQFHIALTTLMIVSSLVTMATFRRMTVTRKTIQKAAVRRQVL
ncbi:hypothetical protein [Paraburkholderia phenazinium]|uniref:Uncharacterized protein n=1 Tax=Paraburkholderia phenazinium TaxID=60549 RepID=A0A1G8P105_9BURK|nr:hypothetical protein [Paraburkholderia phenazinium]SDI86183.1 hypothetical protein SAMN05216466_1399 [Paraburkholderia phenazinium]